MKKIFSKILLVLFSVVTAFSAVACDTSTGEKPKGSFSVTSEAMKETLHTIHEINVTPGTKDLVTNGKSDYKIVIPKNPTNEETTFGASEIQLFLGLATGAEIAVISDEDLPYDDNSKYISFGDTALVEKAGIEVDKDLLTRSGYTIITKGNSVFLVGGGDFGTLWSAYEFLYHEIGWETYSQNETVYSVTSDLKLHEFDIVDVPDFTYRLAAQGWLNNDKTTRLRLRHNAFNTSGKIWMGPNNGFVHNTLEYLPTSKWFESHPKWYSTDLTQLCLNAHGDEEEQKLMFDEFMKAFIDVIESNPDVDNISITQEDYNTWCRCDVCKGKFEKYGTDGADIVHFCNKVSIALEEYFTANNIDRKVNICFFAYNTTTNAPVVKNAEGEWVPIDESVICRDNVFCFYAPIRADYLRDFYHVDNLTYRETMDKWCVLSSHMYLWVYSTRFPDYFDPYNSLNQMQPNYIFFKAHDVSYIFDQMQFNNSYSTDWAFLKEYLQAKLQWNVLADKNKLIEDFMNNFYKNAAGPMKEALKLYNTWFEYLKTEKNIPGPYKNDLIKTEYWPKGIVNTMLGHFDDAYDAIEPLKNSDYALYEKLYDRICMETLPYRLIDITLYFTYYNDDELQEMKKSFKEDVTRLGISHIREANTVDSLWDNWGI
ncbi:MAG: DUF4838 domain-containing protein [Clostridia bacterium]|nr:DUF4838 domain-containing protein [Clostridia bacterium]